MEAIYFVIAITSFVLFSIVYYKFFYPFMKGIIFIFISGGVIILHGWGYLLFFSAIKEKLGGTYMKRLNISLLSLFLVVIGWFLVTTLIPQLLPFTPFLVVTCSLALALLFWGSFILTIKRKWIRIGLFLWLIIGIISLIIEFLAQF